MEKPGLVDHFQPIEQRTGKALKQLLRQRPARPDPLRERLALDEFHDHVTGLVRLEKTHHPHDVGMAE
ncbi:hypothetical protein D3C83_97690 [compost metagenome]